MEKLIRLKELQAIMSQKLEASPAAIEGKDLNGVECPVPLWWGWTKLCCTDEGYCLDSGGVIELILLSSDSHQGEDRVQVRRPSSTEQFSLPLYGQNLFWRREDANHYIHNLFLAQQQNDFRDEYVALCVECLPTLLSQSERL